MTSHHILANHDDTDPDGWLQTVSESAESLRSAIMDNLHDDASAVAYQDLVRATKNFHLAMELFQERSAASKAGGPADHGPVRLSARVG